MSGLQLELERLVQLEPGRLELLVGQLVGWLLVELAQLVQLLEKQQHPAVGQLVP